MRHSTLLVLPLGLLLACLPRLDDSGTLGVDDDDVADDDVSGDDDDAADDDAADDDAADDDTPADDDDTPPDDDDDIGDCPGPGALVLGGEVRDQYGNVGTVFGADAEITLAGWVENPCDVEITFVTPTTCLLDPWTLSAASGNAIGRGCEDAETAWSIGPGASIPDVEYWGRMDPDGYEWATGFLDRWQEIAFYVQ